MNARRYQIPHTIYARAALERGDFVFEQSQWVFRHMGRTRRFTHATINKLIDAGQARRRGKRVVAA